MKHVRFTQFTLAAFLLLTIGGRAQSPGVDNISPEYRFDRTISREVLENYLSRAITMEGLLNGRGDFDDNVRMLKNIGAKFVGRALCLWGGEAKLLSNLERAKELVPKIHAAEPDLILQSCIFEIVTKQVEQVPVPDWVFNAFNQPVEKRNFRYADMLYPDKRFVNHWRTDASVPDVSRMETRLYFYFLGASFIALEARRSLRQERKSQGGFVTGRSWCRKGKFSEPERRRDLQPDDKRTF